MRTLQKKGEKFTVLNLTDPQLGDKQWNKNEAQVLIETVTHLVNETNPDLITVSGDLAWAGQYESYAHLADLLDSFNTPWAPIFGNHDNQDGPESVSKAVEILSQRKNCIFESGDPTLGNGNYVIGIEDNGKLLHAIIMMDSHDRMPWINEKSEEVLEWAQLIPEQLDWYSKTVDDLKELGAKETSLIIHIPLYTYREAIEKALKKDIDPALVPPGKDKQIGCWNEGYTDSFGVFYEKVCSYPEDNGFFDLILKKDSTKTVVCGHDHVNNISICYKGIQLVYALKTGMGCYWRENLNGGTVLTIDSDGKMSVEHNYFVPQKH